jgi:hypothetical protein
VAVVVVVVVIQVRLMFVGPSCARVSARWRSAAVVVVMVHGLRVTAVQQAGEEQAKGRLLERRAQQPAATRALGLARVAKTVAANVRT